MTATVDPTIAELIKAKRISMLKSIFFFLSLDERGPFVTWL
jgi:hypothetical protein